MFTHRPTTRAPHAMVASAHPLATETGLAILRHGGTAIDAGLAVNAVLNVTQPPNCGFGGDAFESRVGAVILDVIDAQEPRILGICDAHASMVALDGRMANGHVVGDGL